MPSFAHAVKGWKKHGQSKSKSYGQSVGKSFQKSPKSGGYYAKNKSNGNSGGDHKKSKWGFIGKILKAFGYGKSKGNGNGKDKHSGYYKKIQKKIDQAKKAVASLLSSGNHKKPEKSEKPKKEGGESVFDKRDDEAGDKENKEDGDRSTEVSSLDLANAHEEASDSNDADDSDTPEGLPPGEPGGESDGGNTGSGQMRDLNELPALTDEDVENIVGAGFGLDRNGRFSVAGAPEIGPGKSLGNEERGEGKLLASARLGAQAKNLMAIEAKLPVEKGEAPLSSDIPKDLVPDLQDFTGEVNEEKSQGLVEQSQSRIQLGDVAGAVTSAQKAVRANPNNLVAYTILAKALNKKGHFQAAEMAAFKAALRDADNEDALESLIIAQLNQETPEKMRDALASINRKLSINPNDAHAYMLRAKLHHRMGDENAMMADVRKAAALNAKFERQLALAEAGEDIFVRGQDDYEMLNPAGDKAPASVPVSRFPMGLLATCALAAAGVLFVLWRKVVAPRVLTGKARLAHALQANEPSAAGVVDTEGLLGGKYQLSRIIGKGGMGQIWEARDHSLNRDVAVKKMMLNGQMNNEQGRALYLKEAQTLAQVHHPNIVDIIEIVDQPAGLYLVFELLKGKTLEQVILEKRRLSLREARKILRPVCQALEFAHNYGVVHRDLKPSNIMITDRDFVKVMDFGIARQAGDAAAHAGRSPSLGGPATMPMMNVSAHTQTIAGTPMYMSPEAYQGVFSPRVDVYAMGIIFYEMVTGGLPFRANTGAERIFVPAGNRMPGVPAGFDDLIKSCVSPDPERRPKDMAEFQKRMEAIPELANRF